MELESPKIEFRNSEGKLLGELWWDTQRILHFRGEAVLSARMFLEMLESLAYLKLGMADEQRNVESSPNQLMLPFPRGIGIGDVPGDPPTLPVEDDMPQDPKISK